MNRQIDGWVGSSFWNGTRTNRTTRKIATGGTDDDDDEHDMAKGKDPVTTTTTTTTKEGEKPGATDKYPGIEGATRGEVDAFLEALDDFQPVVRL